MKKVLLTLLAATATAATANPSSETGQCPAPELDAPGAVINTSRSNIKNQRAQPAAAPCPAPKQDQSHDVHELEKRQAADAAAGCAVAAEAHTVTGTVKNQVAVALPNVRSTGDAGAAADLAQDAQVQTSAIHDGQARHAINTKGTGAAGRTEGACMAIKTKGTGAQ